MWCLFRGDILPPISCIRYSKRQLYLSLSIINWAKLTKRHWTFSVHLSIHLSLCAVRPLSITDSFFSAASLGLTAAISSPNHACLSGNMTGWRVMHRETPTGKLQCCGKQILKLSGNVCIFIIFWHQTKFSAESGWPEGQVWLMKKTTRTKFKYTNRSLRWYQRKAINKFNHWLTMRNLVLTFFSYSFPQITNISKSHSSL